MSKNRELAKNTFIIMLGKFATQFLSFFLLPLYTIYLSTWEYGTFDLISTYIALIMPILSLELSNPMFRFLLEFRNDDRKKKEIFISILLGIFGLTILISLFALIINIFIQIKYIYFILLNIISLMLSSVALQAARGVGKNSIYASGSIVCTIFTIIFNIIFVIFYKMGVEGIFLAVALSNIICFIYIVIKLRFFTNLSLNLFNKKILKEAVTYSIPLIPNGISWWVVNASDRTIISLFVSVSANGIYSVANKFSTMFISLYSVFNLSWTESAALHINDKDKDKFFSETVNTMFILYASISLVIIVMVPFLLSYFINSRYLYAYNYIPLLMIGSVVNVIIGLVSVVYVAKKRSKEIAKTSILAAFINIVLNLILVKSIGVYGACISTIIAFMIMAIYRYIDVQKYVKIKFKTTSLICYVIVLALVIIVYYQNNFIGNIVNLIFVIVYSTIANKKILFSLLATIKEKNKRIGDIKWKKSI